MKTVDRMKMLDLAVADLSEAVKVYAKAMEDAGYAWPGTVVPLHCSKKSIKRRITQIRQNLLMLEKEL